MAARNAASVLPEPVGAATRVLRPATIEGQARTWGSVGVPNRERNQAATAGWKGLSGITVPDREDEERGPRRAPLAKPNTSVPTPHSRRGQGRSRLGVRAGGPGTGLPLNAAMLPDRDGAPYSRHALKIDLGERQAR